MMSISEAKARTVRLEAEDYADEKLASLEAVLYKILGSRKRKRTVQIIFTANNKQ